jgi:hypothetical protein
MKACNVAAIFVMFMLDVSFSHAQFAKQLKQSDSEASCTISYPKRQSSLDTRNDYPVELLQAILEVTKDEYGECKTNPVGPVNQKRARQALETGQLDIAWFPATVNNNERFQPIKVPLRKGLLGWRLLMVNNNEKNKFAEVDSLEKLKAFGTAFGADWQDYPVMKANFDKLTLGDDYEQMFKMLHRKRFDFFSRSLHEVLDEIEYHKSVGYDFAVLDHIMLRYKAVDLFYVNKENDTLYQRIRKGMNKVIVSGKFNELFYSYYEHHIRSANIGNKTIIDLENPMFPDDIEYRDPQLWFQLTDL